MGSLVRQLQQSGRISLYAVLGVSALASIALLAYRIREYNTIEFSFLAWNLILAFIPFTISQLMVLRQPRTMAVLIPGLFFWLLFFPNAPYLVTDLAHLSSTRPAPIWFDLVLLLSFAWNGLMLGYVSLLDVHRIVDVRFGRTAGWLFSGAAIVLGSFGIYVGRFLRWNSWDVFTQPRSLFADIVSRLHHTSEVSTILGVTLAFSAFLMLGYLLLRSLLQLKTSADPAAEAGQRRS